MSGNFAYDAEEISSNFSEDPGTIADKRAERNIRHDYLNIRASKAKASNEVFRNEAALAEGRLQRQNVLSLNAYDRHKLLINEYFLYYPGSTKNFERDKTRDKTDYDVVKRWRTENELKVGKGHFVCGSRKCEEREYLRT